MTSVVSAAVAEAATSAVTSAVEAAASAAKPGIVGTAKAVMNKMPVMWFAKIGVMIGFAAFGAYVLIKRFKSQRKYVETARNDGTLFNGYNRSSATSPVEQILGEKNYTGNPTIFDSMDPLAQEVAKEVKPKLGKVRKPKLNKSQKAQLDSIQRNLRKKQADEILSWGRGLSKSYLAEVDKVASELGLPTYYSIDDDIPEEVRRDYADILS